jgi:cytochrome c peroxidase
MAMTGLDVAPGYMDLGTTNWPHAGRADDLPLFKLTCAATARPHPYLGRVIYTHDPGRALVTGRCREIGAITMQQFRALAARAPYFSNGSARTLRDVIDTYDRRFDMRLTEQEKQDMVNFMGVL